MSKTSHPVSCCIGPLFPFRTCSLANLYNMADAYANQLAFYDAQDKEVMRLFNENPIDWTRLTPFLDEALADPALPRM